MISFDEAIELCGIKCKYCLDLKLLYKLRYDPASYFDFIWAGRYEIVQCMYCCIIGRHVRCTSTTENYENGQLIMKGDEPEIVKLASLKDRIAQAQQKIKEREERIHKEIHDGSSNPIYNKSLSNKFSSLTKYTNVHVELGSMLQKVAEVIKNQNVIMDINWDDINIDFGTLKKNLQCTQSECSRGKDSEGYPVYLTIKIITKVENVKKNFLFVEWTKEKINLTVQYNLIYPRNKAAIDVCDKEHTVIINERMKRMRDIMLESSQRSN